MSEQQQQQSQKYKRNAHACNECFGYYKPCTHDDTTVSSYDGGARLWQNYAKKKEFTCSWMSAFE